MLYSLTSNRFDLFYNKGTTLIRFIDGTGHYSLLT